MKNVSIDALQEWSRQGPDSLFFSSSSPCIISPSRDVCRSSARLSKLLRSSVLVFWALSVSAAVSCATYSFCTSTRSQELDSINAAIPLAMPKGNTITEYAFRTPFAAASLWNWACACSMVKGRGSPLASISLMKSPAEVA